MLVKDGEVWSLCMVEWSKVPGHLDGQEVTQDDDRLKDISGLGPVALSSRKYLGEKKVQMRSDGWHDSLVKPKGMLVF